MSEINKPYYRSAMIHGQPRRYTCCSLSANWICLFILVALSVILYGNLARHVTDPASLAQPRDPSDLEDQTGIKAAFVYLAEPRRMDVLNYSLVTLYKNFNAKYRYPIYIFFAEAEFITSPSPKYPNPESMFQDIQTFVDPEFVDDLHMLLTPWVLPEGETEESIGNFWPTGYKHMIRFWFRNIFVHPKIRKLDYFIRMDTDSFICAPVKYDLFDVSSYSPTPFKYGYYSMLEDEVVVTRYLWDFVENYSESHSAETSENIRNNGYLLPPKSERDTATTPVYYNNFEFVNVAFFLNKTMWDFVEAVDESLGIYLYRWGDAALRYHQVNLFMSKNVDVHQFGDLSYLHSGGSLEVAQGNCPL